MTGDEGNAVNVFDGAGNYIGRDGILFLICACKRVIGATS